MTSFEPDSSNPLTRSNTRSLKFTGVLFLASLAATGFLLLKPDSNSGDIRTTSKPDTPLKAKPKSELDLKLAKLQPSQFPLKGMVGDISFSIEYSAFSPKTWNINWEDPVREERCKLTIQTEPYAKAQSFVAYKPKEVAKGARIPTGSPAQALADTRAQNILAGILDAAEASQDNFVQNLRLIASLTSAKGESLAPSKFESLKAQQGADGSFVVFMESYDEKYRFKISPEGEIIEAHPIDEDPGDTQQRRALSSPATATRKFLWIVGRVAEQLNSTEDTRTARNIAN